MHDAEDSGSGIHFTARKSRESRERPQSGASQASLGTLTGTMTRVNTVASALKRFLSRDTESRPESALPDSLPTPRIPGSASSASMAPKWPGQGSMKITDQVIEEVDEQNTITSMANHQPEVRPTAASIFQPVPRSAPMDVPHSSLGGTPGYYRTHSAVSHNDNSILFPTGGVDALLSASAPAGESMMSKVRAGMQPVDLDRNKSASRDNEQHSITSEEPDVADTTEPPPPDDDFERLRQEREKERQERHKQKLTQTISNQPVMMAGPVGSVLDTELLMEQLSTAEAEMEDKESRRYSTERSESNL
jgi:bestrophin, other